LPLSAVFGRPDLQIAGFLVSFNQGCEMIFPKRTTIQSHMITVVPRYSETDQAGVIHHTAYPVWFEMGRTELLRVNGLAYKALEQAGVSFVIAELYIKYRQPAYYDEELQLETTCSNVTASKIEHTYKLSRCSDNILLAEGSSILACVNEEGKVRRIPEFLYPEE
jgi:acyl-CoA thioester hydrolase